VVNYDHMCILHCYGYLEPRILCGHDLDLLGLRGIIAQFYHLFCLLRIVTCDVYIILYADDVLLISGSVCHPQYTLVFVNVNLAI